MHKAFKKIKLLRVGKGGQIAGNARKELEQESGKKTLSRLTIILRHPKRKKAAK